MKQAIIIIHGIGEQHPMDTLRGFVETVVNELSEEQKPQRWFKPNNSAQLLEQRRVTMEGSSKRVATDFYEFYWAHHVSDTKATHVLRWLMGLLFSNPFSFSKKIAALWLFLWSLIILFFVGIASASGLTYMPSLLFEPELKMGNLLLSAFSFTVYYVNRYFLIRYLGDAARYFSGAPEHVNMRNEILKDGVDFIKHISESGKYGRIIVVGHSLGSVIAYDLLKYIWADYNTQHNNPEIVDTQALNEMEKMINEWPEKPSEETIKTFQKLQEKLWTQQRIHGNPWLITDLITLGSPLTHAPFLLSNNSQEFAIRKSDRELPTCPPVLEKGKIHFYHKSKDFIDKNGEKKSIYNLHHAAGFGPTRWTNLYFKVDLIGGPLQEVFGKGIRDIEVKLTSWLDLAVAHTKYWDCRPFRERQTELPVESSTRKLLESMQLDSRELLEDIDKATK